MALPFCIFKNYDKDLWEQAEEDQDDYCQPDGEGSQ